MNTRTMVIGFGTGILFSALMFVSPQMSFAAAAELEKAAGGVNVEVKKTSGTTAASEEPNKTILETLEKKEDQQNTVQYLNDSATTAKVKGMLLKEEGFDSLDIKVVTVKGEVTLFGTVDTPAQLDAVNKIVNEVEGVTTVNNQLTVKQ